jgi:hypothetical protein
MSSAMMSTMSGPGTAQVSPSAARRLWTALEPIHAAIYFAPEAREAFTGIGLKGFWMGYFASRAAPLGAASAHLVTATFFGFSPAMVRKAIPDAWRFATPEAIIAARYDAADRMLERLLGDADTAAISEAAALAGAIAQAGDVAGRPLFAAHAALDWPDTPRLALWHAATLVREHRGDGHIAALTAAGIDGCTAHVLAVGAGVAARETLQPNRGWTDGEWAAAASRVDGRTSTLKRDIEDATDRLASPPLEAVGQAGVDALLELALPLADRIVAGGGIPMPNPMGVPSPQR